MNLEQEAKDFMMGKRKEFKEALLDATADMADFVWDNLHDSDERQEAINLLKSFELWAMEAVRQHGIK